MRLPEAFKLEVLRLRSSRLLHKKVGEALHRHVGALFPSWVSVSEVGQTPGGRNDLLVFEGDGQSTCFELFASKGQVDRDLLLLRDSPAIRKIAVLVDREIDPCIAEAYYRKRPSRPYPVLWVSEVLRGQQEGLARGKLAEYIAGNRLASFRAISRELAPLIRRRLLETWRRDGIDILADVGTGKASFRQVFTLVAVSRLHRLGLPWRLCKAPAKTVSDSFDFILQQVLIGVPMLLADTRNDWDVLDIGDYEAVLRGGILEADADCVLLLLNPVYDEMRRMYKGALPESGDMGQMLDVMCGATARLLAAAVPKAAPPRCRRRTLEDS